MTVSSTASARWRSAVLALGRRPLALWTAFVLAHLLLGLLNLYAPGLPLGDVTLVYKYWIDQAVGAQNWVGINTVWVYPIVALVPMLIAGAFGLGLYGSTWLTMVMLLNAVAFGFVTGWGRSRDRLPVGWWWVAFLVLLGPIALGRIDSVSVPLALVGVVLLSTRPRAAAAVLTVATWMKVWPAALILAALISVRERWRILLVGASVSAGIVAVGLALGAGSNVFSFVTEQTGRSLQPEAPVSTIWMWLSLMRVPGAFVYYDNRILSYGVTGPGADVAIAVMTPLLAVAIAVIAALGLRSLRAGALAGDLFPPLALALTTAMIAFNKVGSPQYIAWLAVPIVLGLVTHTSVAGRSFRVPAILGLVIAAMTQVVYPYLYGRLIRLDPTLVIVLTARNILEFVLLGWAVFAVVVSARSATINPDEPGAPPTPWPLDAAPPIAADSGARKQVEQGPE